MRLFWSPTARRRALEAVAFIEQDRPVVAVDWLDGLLKRVEALGEFPDHGRVVPEWGDEGVREILYEPYRVIYEVFPEEVHILTLSHFRQELQDR
ncbi:type II toxin-antitoxin system RelE/ParE family toxin [Gaopeijia maritima]|uniref:type II toxin-antitoxin system RelE/ParE family toxin n=1 Tax=Gaopeijia maritima TaxID=3119007 RepID=UPI003243B04B